MYFFKRTPGVLWLYFFKAEVKPNDSKINAILYTKLLWTDACEKSLNPIQDWGGGGVFLL